MTNSITFSSMSLNIQIIDIDFSSDPSYRTIWGMGNIPYEDNHWLEIKKRYLTIFNFSGYELPQKNGFEIINIMIDVNMLTTPISKEEMEKTKVFKTFIKMAIHSPTLYVCGRSDICFAFFIILGKNR